MLNKCPTCGANIKDISCEYCGYTIYSHQQYNSTPYTTRKRSRHRHKRYQSSYNFQNNYSTKDARHSADYDKYNGKNKVITLLLCIFFGALGVHRFYMGNIGMGLFYFFTGGGFGVGWILDIIFISLDILDDMTEKPIKC